MRKYMIVTLDDSAHDTLDSILAPFGEGMAFSDIPAARSAIGHEPY